jgi:hypothetical protein
MPGIVKQKGLTALTRTVQVENPKSSVMLLAENDDSQIEKTDKTFTGFLGRDGPVTFHW